MGETIVSLFEPEVGPTSPYFMSLDHFTVILGDILTSNCVSESPSSKLILRVLDLILLIILALFTPSEEKLANSLQGSYRHPTFFSLLQNPYVLLFKV
jgi:hypothetical protein